MPRIWSGTHLIYSAYQSKAMANLYTKNEFRRSVQRCQIQASVHQVVAMPQTYEMVHGKIINANMFEQAPECIHQFSFLVSTTSLKSSAKLLSIGGFICKLTNSAVDFSLTNLLAPP